MVRKYIYADESGDMTFTRGRGASRYFILTSIVLEDHSLATALTELRRELAWQGVDTKDGFHATNDKQATRDEVFKVLQQFEFRVDATIIDKPKAQPKIRQDTTQFYQYAWYYHLKHLASQVASKNDELLVVAASINLKRKLSAFKAAIEDVLWQVSPTRNFQCAMWSASSAPAIQAADYCSWAIGRKWESNNLRSYNLIKGKIRSEYDLFARGARTYY